MGTISIRSFRNENHGCFFVALKGVLISQLFKNIKATVTARQAAERYGLKVERSGLARCPFHQDRNPSLKVDTRYYCFGCGATGDVIDLTMQLLGLSPLEAASRLADDFGIEAERIRNAKGTLKNVKETLKSASETPDKEKNLLIDYFLKIFLFYGALLEEWKEAHAPKTTEEEWHPLFCESLQKKDFIEDRIDELMLCSKDQFEEIKNCCGKEVARIESRLGKAFPGGKAEACSAIDRYDR